MCIFFARRASHWSKARVATQGFTRPIAMIAFENDSTGLHRSLFQY